MKNQIRKKDQPVQYTFICKTFNTIKFLRPNQIGYAGLFILEKILNLRIILNL